MKKAHDCDLGGSGGEDDSHHAKTECDEKVEQENNPSNLNEEYL